MNFFYILVILSVGGIGAVFWIMKSDTEEDQEGAPQEDAQPQKASPKSGKFTKLISKKDPDAPKGGKSSTKSLGSLFKKIRPGKKEEGGPTAPMSGPEDQEPPEPTGTAGMTTSPAVSSANTALSEQEEKTIENEIEISARLEELKVKYDKLESLYKEKTTEYEKTKESLDHELEHRKEFNKVKDLLEKELKDSKDKTRSVEVELTNAKTENENQKKRSDQLEEKTGKLEKEILQKDDKIDELVKRMQTFASPATADSPPASEESKPESPAPEPPSSPEAPQAPAQDAPKPQQPEQPQPEPATTAPAEPEKLEETPKPEEKSGGEEANPPQKPPADDSSAPKGGFKLELDIEKPDEEGPQKENFLKLQPDVMDNGSNPQKPDNKDQTPEPPASDKNPEDKKPNP